MTKYKILIEPDPILRQKCEPIGQVDDEIKNTNERYVRDDV